MVRKRSKRQIEDSDEEHSITENEMISTTKVSNSNEPANRRYSLRTRKTVKQPDDFEDVDKIEGIDEEDAENSDEDNRQTSDDEDFEIDEDDVENEEDVDEPEEIAPCEDEAPVPDDEWKESSPNLDFDGGLIDFEDIIRADIVQKRRTGAEVVEAAPKTSRKRSYSPLIVRNRRKRALSKSAAEDSDKEDDIPIAELKNIYNNVEPPPHILMKRPERLYPVYPQVKNHRLLASNGTHDDTNGRTVADKKEEVVAPSEKINGKADSLPLPDLVKDSEKAVSDKNEDEEDDDVIVLGELKPELIVLDDD